MCMQLLVEFAIAGNVVDVVDDADGDLCCLQLPSFGFNVDSDWRTNDAE